MGVGGAMGGSHARTFEDMPSCPAQTHPRLAVDWAGVWALSPASEHVKGTVLQSQAGFVLVTLDLEELPGFLAPE